MASLLFCTAPSQVVGIILGVEALVCCSRSLVNTIVDICTTSAELPMRFELTRKYVSECANQLLPAHNTDTVLYGIAFPSAVSRTSTAWAFCVRSSSMHESAPASRIPPTGIRVLSPEPPSASTTREGHLHNNCFGPGRMQTDGAPRRLTGNAAGGLHNAGSITERSDRPGATTRTRCIHR